MKQVLTIVLLSASLFATAQTFEELVATKTCEYLGKDKKALDSLSTITRYISRSTLEVAMEDKSKNYLAKITTVEGIQGTTRKVYTLLSKSCKEYHEVLPSLIVNESKAGGMLDFQTRIKGHEMEGVEVKPGLFTSKISLALYQWGKSTGELGIQTVDEALALWTKSKERNPDEREKSYISSGFKKEFEK